MFVYRTRSPTSVGIPVEWLEEWAEEKRDSDKEHFARVSMVEIPSLANAG